MSMQSIPSMSISNDFQKRRTLENCLQIWLDDKYNLFQLGVGEMAVGIFLLGSKNFPFLLVLVLVLDSISNKSPKGLSWS